MSRITQSSAHARVLKPSFLYGAASASHQIEGGYLADGKSLSVWDAYWQANNIKDNGNVACDSYNLWKEDVKLLKQYGANVYRFSISWSRVLPEGKAGTPVNEAGIKYYSDLCDALLAEGIQPCITVFHWDHPQCLQEEYGGFKDQKQIVRDFVGLADLLFARLGDRCKHWITINEPHIFTFLEAMVIQKANWVPIKDHVAYTKTLLLCNAHTVDLYRRKYQTQQQGRIGITLNCDWMEPIDDSAEAKEGAAFVLDWIVGMYAAPIYLGHFPERMQKELGPELEFTEEEWKLVKLSSEFFGLNTYTTSLVKGQRASGKLEDMDNVQYFLGVYEKTTEKDGQPIGVQGEGRRVDVPWGLRKLLNYLSVTYAQPGGVPIIITENGFPTLGEADRSRDEIINDKERQTFYEGYLKEMVEAVRDDGVDMEGFMAWSLLDNLEWIFGYGPRFGVTYVDRDDGCKRYPKGSAYMLRDIFKHAIRPA